MSMLENHRAEIRWQLQSMAHPVRLIHFTQPRDCQGCAGARKLLEELAGVSDSLTLEVYDSKLDDAQAASYGIERAPATAMVGARDYGIRIYGLPVGFEFAVLLQDILQVSRRDSALCSEARSALATLSAPVHLQVFSTPTCPYCPGMALLAHQMAIESQWIRADLIDATEYPDLVRKHNVRGVPKTLINGVEAVEGSVSEAVLLEIILKMAARKMTTVQI